MLCKRRQQEDHEGRGRQEGISLHPSPVPQSSALMRRDILISRAASSGGDRGYQATEEEEQEDRLMRGRTVIRCGWASFLGLTIKSHVGYYLPPVPVVCRQTGYSIVYRRFVHHGGMVSDAVIPTLTTPLSVCRFSEGDRVEAKFPPGPLAQAGRRRHKSQTKLGSFNNL